MKVEYFIIKDDSPAGDEAIKKMLELLEAGWLWSTATATGSAVHYTLYKNKEVNSDHKPLPKV